MQWKMDIWLFPHGTKLKFAKNKPQNKMSNL